MTASQDEYIDHKPEPLLNDTERAAIRTPARHAPCHIAPGLNCNYIIRSGRYIAKSVGDDLLAINDLDGIAATLNSAPQLAEDLESACCERDRIMDERDRTKNACLQLAAENAKLREALAELLANDDLSRNDWPDDTMAVLRKAIALLGDYSESTPCEVNDAKAAPRKGCNCSVCERARSARAILNQTAERL